MPFCRIRCLSFKLQNEMSINSQNKDCKALLQSRYVATMPHIRKHFRTVTKLPFNWFITWIQSYALGCFLLAPVWHSQIQLLPSYPLYYKDTFRVCVRWFSVAWCDFQGLYFHYGKIKTCAPLWINAHPYPSIDWWKRGRTTCCKSVT